MRGKCSVTQDRISMPETAQPPVASNRDLINKNKVRNKQAFATSFALQVSFHLFLFLRSSLLLLASDTHLV